MFLVNQVGISNKVVEYTYNLHQSSPRILHEIVFLNFRCFMKNMMLQKGKITFCNIYFPFCNMCFFIQLNHNNIKFSKGCSKQLYMDDVANMAEFTSKIDFFSWELIFSQTEFFSSINVDNFKDGTKVK